MRRNYPKNNGFTKNRGRRCFCDITQRNIQRRAIREKKYALDGKKSFQIYKYKELQIQKPVLPTKPGPEKKHLMHY